MKKQHTTKLKKRIRTMIPYHLTDLDLLFLSKVTADRVRAILQLLFFVRQRMKDNPNYAPGIDRTSRYCPVEADTILKVIAGNGYRKIINRMLELRIIEIKRNEESGRESFAPNKWTKLYRIHPRLWNKSPEGKSYRREFITHPDVIRAVRRYYNRSWDRQLKQVQSQGGVYADIVRYSEQFAIDVRRLEKDIQAQGLPETENLLERAQQVEDKLLRHCHRDEYGYRLHTHLGNMPKELRRYLVLRNAPETDLVLLDVKSSQPYFISLLFHKPELLNLVPEFLPIKHLLEDNRNVESIKTFYQDCCNGAFYQKCFVLLGDGKQTVQEFTEEEKGILKKKLFQHIFYGSAGNYHKDEEKKEERLWVETRFRTLYPTVHDNLVKLKRVRKAQLPFLHEYYRSRNKATKMYSLPNCLAQRLESKILLDIIAATLFRLGIPVFTIHDAFILESAHLETLEQIFEQVFRDQLGVKPPKLDTIKLTTEQQ